MTTYQFNEILNNRLKKIKSVLRTKAKEYAFNDDCIHNFRLASKITGVSVEKCIWGMAMKHLVSVIDLVENRLENTEPNVTEKIGNMINYLILLEAALYEVRNNSNDE